MAESEETKPPEADEPSDAEEADEPSDAEDADEPSEAEDAETEEPADEATEAAATAAGVSVPPPTSEDQKTEERPAAPAAPEESKPPPAPGTGGQDRPTLEEVLGWRGDKLDEMGGATVARIEGTYVDAQSGFPEWLLVRMGRFGHHSLVPAREAVGAVGRVWVPYSRDVIRQAPRVKPGTPLQREHELTLLDHYGIGRKTGRGTELEPRDADVVTARPPDGE